LNETAANVPSARERRALGLFIAVGFGFSWGVAELYFRWLPQAPLHAMLMAFVFMYGPALGAVVATHWGLRQPLRWLGPVFGWNRWVVFAWLAPVLFGVGYVLVGALLPGMSLNLDTTALTTTIYAQVPADQHAQLQAKLDPIADWLPLVLLAQVLLGGLFSAMTITALATFGEELGWRGFLHRLWSGWGFWRRAAMIGVLWGLWHAPLILRGHNYPEHPQIGVAVMVLFCLGLSPLFEFFRARAGCVFAAVVFHASINAGVGISLFVAGGSDLMRGPAGLAGLIVLAFANLVLWAWMRRAPPRAAVG
jgi:membrane protease YdiL (CAAX protease family)